MRTLIVTAANEAFMPLLRGLIHSLAQWQPQPFTAIACFDLGLAPESQGWVQQQVAHLVVPGWDLPVDPQLCAQQPHLRAFTVRPFLRDHFPGYDLYLWIDADAWVQEPFALDWYFAIARSGCLAAAPEVDRAYRDSPNLVEWRTGRMQQYFGDEAGKRAVWDTYFNAGVFALAAKAPHWQPWAECFRQGLEATRGRLCCDQTALNHALWTQNLPVHALPATANWLCHLAAPGYNPRLGKFCEPLAPSGLIGILHLTGSTKHLAYQGGTQTISLRFPGPVAQPG